MSLSSLGQGCGEGEGWKRPEVEVLVTLPSRACWSNPIIIRRRMESFSEATAEELVKVQ